MRAHGFLLFAGYAGLMSAVVVSSFSPIVYKSLGNGIFGCSPGVVALKMAKRKESMSAKRARRNARKNSSSASSVQDKPRCKLDFTTVSRRNEAITSAGSTTTTKGLDASKKITDPKKAEQKAQRLVQAQRESVDMLTLVRERVESLPADAIRMKLGDQGYFVLDNFLDDKRVLDQLRKESSSMLADMEVDVSNIGSGEYILGVEGGEEQYAQCPRLVELVVSSTKHLPSQLKQEENLDASACMANLRTFDRKAFKASVALLTGEDSEESMEMPPRAYGVVATESNDQRRITMFYYILSESWTEGCGGGLVFESSSETVSAKSDRLVLFNSDSTSFRQDPWKGNEGIDEFGSCVELHLVQKL